MYKRKGKKRTTDADEYILAHDLDKKAPRNISVKRLKWFSVGKKVYKINRLEVNDDITHSLNCSPGAPSQSSSGITSKSSLCVPLEGGRMRSFFFVVPSAFFSVHPLKTTSESETVTINVAKALLRNIMQELVLESRQKVDQKPFGIMD